MNVKHRHLDVLAVLTVVGLATSPQSVAVEVQQTPTGLVVTGERYRAQFTDQTFGFDLALRDFAGQWKSVTKENTAIEFGVGADGIYSITTNARAQLVHRRAGDAVIVGVNTLLSPLDGLGATLHFICTDDGILTQFKLTPCGATPGRAVCWALPRIGLDELRFDAYTFWAADGQRHSGRLDALGKEPAYAGVTAWGTTGDIVPRLSQELPAVIARSEKTGIALGVVLVDPAGAWDGGHAFLQRYRPDVLFLYAGNTQVAKAQQGLWGWLAPFDGRDADACERHAWKLVAQTKSLLKGFQPVAPLTPPSWSVPPDLPTELRRKQPVADINDAAVYTINEEIHTPYGVALARKVASDVLIRAWFKWRNAPDWSRFSRFTDEARALGALFGGGTTCSALYHGENGLTEADVLDMATRGPAGRLVDAWNTPRCRHGTLSNPRYLDYILRWCRAQIDAGADYLFMDEHNAALERREGYDDYSLHDFRDYLLRAYCAEQGWSRTDVRWRERFGVDCADRGLCPDGTMASFDYRAFLRQRGLVEQPLSTKNPFVADWQKFRTERDERAWKRLTDGIRDYARGKGRRMLISANGIAKFVDLQVLGVWGLWRVKEDRVDLSESQMHDWHAIVRRGWSMAGCKVPVVFFHDWGFMGFPWLRVPPSDRELWMRVRGAEIYAAGGFFAFPVTGPFGCDALKDGTLGGIARQTRFYSQHKDLFLRAQPLAMDCIESDSLQLSTALWMRAQPPAVILHVINRATDGDRRRRREGVNLDVPTTVMPERVAVVSPDEGQVQAKARRAGGKVRVQLTGLDAYSVIVLDYRKLPKLSVKGSARVVPTLGWERPTQNEFVVYTGGVVDGGWNLQVYFQGRLHSHLRNPPTFIINAPKGGKLLVRVRAVARAGARLEFRVDEKLAQAADLPDRDGKNDGEAPEYGEVITFAIPPGRHRLTLDNTGSDWARLDWLEFQGVFDEPSGSQR